MEKPFEYLSRSLYIKLKSIPHKIMPPRRNQRFHCTIHQKLQILSMRQPGNVAGDENANPLEIRDDNDRNFLEPEGANERNVLEAEDANGMNFRAEDEMEEEAEEEQEEEKEEITLYSEVQSAQIKAWAAKKEVYQRMPSNIAKKTFIIHPGPKRKYSSLYGYLYQIVKEMRAERVALDHHMLIRIAVQEEPEVGKLTYNGQRSLIDRFMSLYGLSIRNITSVRQEPEEITEEGRLVEEFKAQYAEVLASHQIPEEAVFNMDQTALYYEIPPKKTIEIVGTKQVAIATSGDEKKRVTIISLIGCNGARYRQMVIFKAVHKATVYKSLQRLNDDETYFSTQENAWIDEDQLEEWLNNVWYPIAREIEGPKLLLLDKHPLHFDKKHIFEKFGTHLLFVPTKMTHSLQPLDQNYHRAYKTLARQYFMRNKQIRRLTEEAKRQSLVECVKEIHASITIQIIRDSWSQAHLSYPIQENQMQIPPDDSMQIEVENSQAYSLEADADENLFA